MLVESDRTEPSHRLRRSDHAMHHTPELMQRWNFNVTVPLADWLLGTIYRGQRR